MNRHLKLSATAALALALGAALAAQGRPAAPLRLLHTTPLPRVRGRIDHFDVDLSGHRLFMSALGNNTVEVFDLRTLQPIHQLTGMAEPQGITYASRANRLFVANGDDGSVRVYDGSSYRLLKTVHLASDADDTRYDVARNQVWVGYGGDGSAGLGILDGTTGDLVGTVPLPGHPESFQLEPSGPLLFVNIPTAGHIVAVVNRDQRRVVATWRLGGARENFPMALDAPGRRLYVTGRAPAQMLVLDTGTGKILDRLAVSGDADDMWYDAARRRIYISGGQGTISVVQVDKSGGYSLRAEVPTAPGGRTSFFAPQLDRLFVGVWGRGGRPEELRVYAPLP